MPSLARRLLAPLSLLAITLVVGCAADTTDDTGATDTTASTSQAFTPASATDPAVVAAMNAAAIKYGFPRWFVYATVHRESSFNKNARNGSGTGACDVGYGLTQITCPHHAGLSFPNNLSAANQADGSWQGDMRISAFCNETGLCPWIDMTYVTKLGSATERFDPVKNLDRYFSGYAAPAFHLERARAPQQAGESKSAFDRRILRRVAWHWRYGHYQTAFAYPTDPKDYFSGPDAYRWDNHAATYRAAVEPIDGVWDGDVCKPPYSASGCGTAGTGASSPASAPSASSIKYDFEDGTQGWTFAEGGLVSSVFAQTARAASGSSSLAVKLSGSAATRNVWTSGALPNAGNSVTMRFWIPTGSKISWVQAYVQEGAGGGWAWTTATENMSELTAGAWNTLSLMVPTDAAPLAALGIQFGTSSASTETVYLDSVTW